MNAPEKALIPSLRFPEFSGAWEEKRLGDIATYKAGKFVAASAIAERRQDGHYPCYGANGLRGYTTSTTHSGSYPIIGRQGALCGNVRIVSGDFHATEHAVVVSSKKSTSVSWLFYELGKLKINRFATGQAQPGVSVETIESLKTHIPTLPEQQKIADYLGAVDAKLRLLERRRDALTAYKKGMMQRIFAQEIRFTQEDGTAFPDWQEKQLGDVFKEVTDKVGSRDLETYSISAGKGYISQKEKFGKDISGNQNPNYIALQSGQFAYNKGNSKTFKYGCVYLNDLEKVIAVPNVFISFEVRNDVDVNDYFQQNFEFHILDRGLRRIISSSARMDGLLNISKVNFFKLKIPYPHPDEQQKIADFLSAIDEKITAATRRITAMQDFKKSMLQQMFV